MTRLHFFFAEGSADVLFDNGKGHAFRTAVSWLTDAVLVSNPFNDLTPPAVRDKLQVGTAGCLAMGNFTGNGIQILTLHAILLTVHEKFQILQMRTRFLSARKESARCWLKSSLTFRNPPGDQEVSPCNADGSPSMERMRETLLLAAFRALK